MKNKKVNWGESTHILIKPRKKYQQKGGSQKNGSYVSRTNRPIRIGYKKHRYEGNTRIPKYPRQKP